MLSTFHGIEMGKRGLISHNTAINTTGENLQNLNNPAYSRRIAKLSSTPAIDIPGVSSTTAAGQIGSGTQVERIHRVRDYFLESRLTNENGLHGYWKKTFETLQQIESVYHSTTAGSLKENLQQFMEAWNLVGQEPQSLGKRDILKTKGVQLTQSIQKTFHDLTQLSTNVKKELSALVQDINQIAKKLAHINGQITSIKAEGKNPNTLLDKRDALIQELSSKVPIQTVHSDVDDAVMVFIGSSILVQGSQFEELELIHDATQPQKQRIIWKNTSTELNTHQKGELFSLLKMHNEVLPYQQSLLNQFSVNLIQGVNTLHQQGFGLNGNTGIRFFGQDSFSPEPFGQFNVNETDGAKLGIYQLTGNQSLNPNSKLVKGGELEFNDINSNRIRITYNAGDSVQDVIQRINESSANIVASLDSNEYLVLKSAEPKTINGKETFLVEHVQDSGIFLSGYAGILKSNESFDWNNPNSMNVLEENIGYSIAMKSNPASWIHINQDILADTRNIAAASSNNGTMTGKGDGQNALKIMLALQGTKTNADIASNGFIVDKQERHFGQFLDDQVQALAADTQFAQLELQKESSIMQHLVQRQQSISGVNVDEEMTSLVTYQYGYNASARFITYVDRMLNTLIREMGV